MYIVVVGEGNIGRSLIDMATSGGNEVVVIERDEARAEAASVDFDCLVVKDEATTLETLQDAGADRADALVSTTDQDATNVMVCLLGKEVEIPAIVSVVHEAEHMDLFSRIGVTTIENPQRLIAEYLYRAVKRPTIVDFMRVGETAEVFEITVVEDAPVVGMTIQEIADRGLLGDDVLIVVLDREGETDLITPRGGTRIESEDLLTVYSA